MTASARRLFPLFLPLLLWTISPPPASGAILNTVQTGTTTIAAGGTTVTVGITAIDPTRSILWFQASHDQNTPNSGAISGQITNGTTLTFQRIGNTGLVNIRWHVSEFACGVSVQRGSTPKAAAVVNVPISAVDLTKTFVLISDRRNGNTFGSDDFTRARLTSPTNLELATVGGGVAGVVEWQVIEVQSGASVQSGLVSFPSGDDIVNVTISAVDRTRSFLVFNYRSASGTGSNIGQKMVRGRIRTSTQVQFDREETDQSIDISWFVVSWTDGTTVQSGTQRFRNNQTVRNVTIANVDPTRTVAFSGANLSHIGQAGGKTRYNADDNPGKAAFRHALTSPTNLRLTRDSSGGGARANVAWFVVQFASPPISATPFYPDAAAAGMNPVVTFVGAPFQSSTTVTTSSSDIVLGPTIVTDTAGTVASPGCVMQTIFFVRPEAAPTAAITVTLGGTALTQTFDIVIPNPDPNVPDLGSGTLTGRSRRGTSVLGGLTVGTGGTLTISTADTDAGTAGNQGHLPAVILVKGDVIITGTLDARGPNGTDGGPNNTGGDGGAGGPGGGGGGGAGVRQGGTAIAAPGGAGYSGGGGGGSKGAGGSSGGAGGDGTGAAGGAPSGTSGGPGGAALSGATGGGGAPRDPGRPGGGGGGGGTGNPFGGGGLGAPGGGGNDGGAGGEGGGGGGAVGNTPGGGGGGGFGTAGQNAADATDFGKGGLVNGNAQMVPLSGGSGGGGGAPDQGGPNRHRGGGGGGGGAAVLIYATGSVTVSGTLTAAGGNGGNGHISGGNGSGGGGGGSGGAILLESGNVTVSGTLTTAGGTGGTSTGSAAGGAGGSGRIRIDGLAAGATVPGTAGSTFIGPAIDTLVDTTVTGRADGGSTVTLYVLDSSGSPVGSSPYTATTSGAAGTVGSWSVTGVTFPTGTGYLAVKQGTGIGCPANCPIQVFGRHRATRGAHLINWREVY